MRYTIILCFLLASCGMPKNVVLNGWDEYVLDFENEAKKRGFNVSIDNLVMEWAVLDEKYAGTCTPLSTPLIKINTLFWDNASEVEKWVVMYHELGHCILGKEHSGDKEHMMYPYILKNIDFFTKKDYYLDKFFYEN